MDEAPGRGGGLGVKPPKFRTFVEGEPHRRIGPLPKFVPYSTLEEMPEPVRQKVREIWRKGIQSEEIADLIEIPLEWVQLIVGEKKPPVDGGTTHHKGRGTKV